MELQLGFIGAGNMSNAIINGILKSGSLSPKYIMISNRHPDKLESFKARGIHTTMENQEVARWADMVILGIKPQMFGDVLPEISTALAGKGVVSISPGYSVAYLKRILPGCHVMRAMPNTPLLLGKGVTAVAAAPQVPVQLFHALMEAFSTAGEVFVVPETLMDTVIGVSGSSPAFFFRMAGAMVQEAKERGMGPDQALRMVALTMEGAAKMLLDSGKSASELTHQVCSPGGTTLAALSAFDEFKFEDMISQAMDRCEKRSMELGR